MNEREPIDAELVEIERGLDRLAQADRAALPESSLARIAAAAAQACAPAPAIHVASWRRAPMRLAAGLALIASLGALWMARRSSPSASPEAEQLDAWMATVWPNEDSDPFAEAIEGLEADADALGASRLEPWTLDLTEEDSL